MLAVSLGPSGLRARLSAAARAVGAGMGWVTQEGRFPGTQGTSGGPCVLEGAGLGFGAGLAVERGSEGSLGFCGANAENAGRWRGKGGWVRGTGKALNSVFVFFLMVFFSLY